MGKIKITVIVSSVIIIAFAAFWVGPTVHRKLKSIYQEKKGSFKKKTLQVKEAPVNLRINENALAPTPWPAFQADARRTGRSPSKGEQKLRKKWIFQVNSIVESSVVIGVDGALYFGAYDSNFLSVTPLGKLRWKFPTRGPVRATAAIARDGSIYVSSRDGCLYALTPQGDAKWIKVLSKKSIDSSPIIDNDGNIFVASHDGHLYALNPDGQVKWVSESLGHISTSSPAISEDGKLYIGSYDGNLYALNSRDGAVEWKFKTSGGIRASPSIDRETIYIGSRDDTLYAINKDGMLKWKFKTKGDIRATTAISKEGLVLFGSWDGDFYALSPEGNLLWKFRTGKPIEVSASVDDNGNIYFTSTTGSFYVLNHDGKLRQRFGTATFIHGTPVIDSNGSIYITAGTRVIAFGTPLPFLELSVGGQQFAMKDTIAASVVVHNPSEIEKAVILKIWLQFVSSGGKQLVKIDDRVLVLKSGFSTFDIALNPFMNEVSSGLYALRGRLISPLTGEEIDYKENFFYRYP